MIRTRRRRWRTTEILILGVARCMTTCRRLDARVSSHSRDDELAW